MKKNSQYWIRTIIMWFGLLLLMVVFIPYIKEYAFDGPEKHFGSKEGIITSIGFVLAVGARFWNKIAEAISNKFFGIINNKN